MATQTFLKIDLGNAQWNTSGIFKNKKLNLLCYCQRLPDLTPLANTKKLALQPGHHLTPLANTVLQPGHHLTPLANMKKLALHPGHCLAPMANTKLGRLRRHLSMLQ